MCIDLDEPSFVTGPTKTVPDISKRGCKAKPPIALTPPRRRSPDVSAVVRVIIPAIVTRFTRVAAKLKYRLSCDSAEIKPCDRAARIGRCLDEQ